MTTPTVKSIRIPDDLWEQVKTIAAERGDVPSEVVRAGLEQYVGRAATRPRSKRSRAALLAEMRALLDELAAKNV